MGTLQVNRYLSEVQCFSAPTSLEWEKLSTKFPTQGPRNRSSAILSVEKSGFNGLFKAESLHEERKFFASDQRVELNAFSSDTRVHGRAARGAAAKAALASLDPELPCVIDRWPELSTVVKTGIVAMVRDCE